MRSFPWLMCVVAIACCANESLADGPADDPLHALLLSPEVLMQHRERIGLTDNQVEQIRARLEEAGPQAEQRQMRLNQAMGRFAELLSAEKVDEDAALKQLDEVLALEKELKQLHVRVMIRIRNELTAEQRQVAAQLQRAPVSGEEVEQRLQSKVSRIEKAVQARAEAGKPPFEVVGLMQKLPELMQRGQIQEAEALLDRVLAMLGVDQPAGASGKSSPQPGLPAKLTAKIRQVQQRAQERQQKGEDVSEIQQLMKQVPALLEQGKTEEAERLLDRALQSGRTAPKKEEQSLSPEATRAAVDALKKEDVAWRRIDWKTCLLDGLQASREQNKPIMLWVFIDRPIDDERC